MRFQKREHLQCQDLGVQFQYPDHYHFLCQDILLNEETFLLSSHKETEDCLTRESGSLWVFCVNLVNQGQVISGERTRRLRGVCRLRGTRALDQSQHGRDEPEH